MRRGVPFRPTNVGIYSLPEGTFKTIPAFPPNYVVMVPLEYLDDKDTLFMEAERMPFSVEKDLSKTGQNLVQ